MMINNIINLNNQLQEKVGELYGRYLKADRQGPVILFKTEKNILFCT